MSAAKAVLITGAARRLGRATALYLAEKGYDIALHYYGSEEDAVSAKEAVEAFGQQCVLLKQDLRELAALPALITKAREVMPHLCVLVNNASTFRRISFADTTPESLEEDMALNFKAPFFLIQAFAAQVGQGSVVNMLDTAITGHYGAYFAYLLAKKNLAEFTYMAARELAPQLRVNAVCPGFVLPTEGDGAQHDPHHNKAMLLAQPTPGDIAEAVYTLAENKALTGQLLMINGGEHLK